MQPLAIIDFFDEEGKPDLDIEKQGLAMRLGKKVEQCHLEKQAHLLVESPVKKAFLAQFRQTSPACLFFTMRYDWMYSSQE